jgi:hypothetical protein
MSCYRRYDSPRQAIVWFLKAEESLRGHKDSEHYVISLLIIQVKYHSFTMLEIRNLFGMGICLRKLENYFESMDVLRSILPKLDYLIKIYLPGYFESEKDKKSTNSPLKIRRSNTRDNFIGMTLKKQVQLDKLSKLTALVFMNLSRTLEFMSKYYHSEVLCRAAMHTAEDSIDPPSQEFGDLCSSFYSFIAGKVIYG